MLNNDSKPRIVFEVKRNVLISYKDDVQQDNDILNIKTVANISVEDNNDGVLFEFAINYTTVIDAPYDDEDRTFLSRNVDLDIDESNVVDNLDKAVGLVGANAAGRICWDLSNHIERVARANKFFIRTRFGGRKIQDAFDAFNKFE